MFTVNNVREIAASLAHGIDALHVCDLRRPVFWTASDPSKPYVRSLVNRARLELATRWLVSKVINTKDFKRFRHLAMVRNRLFLGAAVTSRRHAPSMDTNWLGTLGVLALEVGEGHVQRLVAEAKANCVQ